MLETKRPILILAALLVAVSLAGCMETENGEVNDDVGGEFSPTPTPTETTGGAGANATDDPGASPSPTGSLEGGAGTEDDPASGTFTISMVEYAFEPEEVWVEQGTTVVWENDGQVVHTATAGDDSWGTGDVAAGERAENVFDQEGEFDYRCVYHEVQGMVGTVHVVAA